MSKLLKFLNGTTIKWVYSEQFDTQGRTDCLMMWVGRDESDE